MRVFGETEANHCISAARPDYGLAIFAMIKIEGRGIFRGGVRI
jgi:hypothetical protein